MPNGCPWCALIRLASFTSWQSRQSAGASFVRWIVEFAYATLAGLVRNVTGIASHVQRRMTAAVLRDVYAGLVAGKAKIRIFVISAR